MRSRHFGALAVLTFAGLIGAILFTQHRREVHPPQRDVTPQMVAPRVPPNAMQNRPSLHNPGGVDGTRPARPVPGLK